MIRLLSNRDPLLGIIPGSLDQWWSGCSGEENFLLCCLMFKPGALSVKLTGQINKRKKQMVLFTCTWESLRNVMEGGRENWGLEVPIVVQQ